jgi:hypothetical protein
MFTRRSAMDDRRNVAFCCPLPRDIGVSYPLALTRYKRLFPLLDAGYHIPSQICQQEYGAEIRVRIWEVYEGTR